jgi:4-hydroxybenzoate polyprenyltransferase
MAAVAMWVAGFDILYACQDAEFDRNLGLHSVPSRLGIPRSLVLAVVLHVACICFLAVFGWVFALGGWFWCGVTIFATLITSQHVTVYRHGLASIDQVFFVRNGLASVLLFMFVILDVAFQ